uniref:Ig-like domain-containing protein n=1 Tax=Sarcophilus harrisii TaxID=9305 RepID=A0A7N4NGX4_SARHA
RMYSLWSGVGAQKIHQWPATKLQVAGSQLFLECSTEGISEPNLYWYHQPLGGGLHLLTYSISINHVENEMPHRFSSLRSRNTLFQLSSQKLFVNDSGFFFCAWSLTLNGVRHITVQ